MDAAHTPRGRVASLAKRRRLGSASAVQGASSSIASIGSATMIARTAIHAHSRTPKWGSAAKGRIAFSRDAGGTSSSCPTANAAHPRTVSEECWLRRSTGPSLRHPRNYARRHVNRRRRDVRRNRRHQPRHVDGQPLGQGGGFKAARLQQSQYLWLDPGDGARAFSNRRHRAGQSSRSILRSAAMAFAILGRP
jgi:hypothetical protein